MQILGILADEIEDALPPRIALRPVRIRGRGKQTLEDELRIDFLRQGLRGRPPGHGRGINTAVAGIAIAGHGALFAANFERRQAGLFTNARGGNLIDGDADADVGAIGLACLGSSQERGQGAGVIAAAIAVSTSLVGGQAG